MKHDAGQNDSAPSPLDAIADDILDGIRERGTYRRMRVLDGLQAPRMQVDGRDVLLFAGSNYLDLARHPEVIEAAERASRDYGCAAGGRGSVWVASRTGDAIATK